MAIREKYQGKEYSRDKNTESYKESFYGTEAEINTFITTLPAIGANVTGKGFFTRYSKTQGDGNIYQVEAEYTVEHDASFANTSSTVVGVKSAQLSVRNIQMPLEAKTGYRTCWNYYLEGLGDATLPAWWETATDTIISIADRKNYQWIKSLSEMPLDPDANGKYWKIVAQPTKPGVEYWDKACFVVTESAKYNSPNAAGNAISISINTITPPETTFNISGGDWKYDEANVSYDGKHWIATSVYTHSGDSLGWDLDLYD